MPDSNELPTISFEMSSQPRLLSAVRALICKFAHRYGFDEHECGQISLAVDEALCNVINHGYDRKDDGRIWVSLWPNYEDHGLRVVIEDNAIQVDPAMIQPRDLADIRPGGLGVHIIREVMDIVTYEKREQCGMRLTMIKFPRHPFGAGSIKETVESEIDHG